MSKKTLAKLEFKKHVAAIHTSGELSLLERKIVNVLLLNAYDDLLVKRTHSIPVTHLAEMLGWDASKNVERLQDALRTIVGTSVEFNILQDGADSWEITNLLAYAKIHKGICSYKYVEELASRLFDPEIYATININVQQRFKGGYSLTLYENCVRFKNVGTTGFWDIDKFRRIVGAEAPMYDEFKRLVYFVINKSIAEINKQSDITLAVEYQRTGRKVTAVKFLISDNAQKTLLSPEQLSQTKGIHDSPTYIRLREHGIGDKLAVAWVLQDEQRAQEVVNYVESRDRHQPVKSTAGYIRKLFEENAEVGTSKYAKQASGWEEAKKTRNKDKLKADKLAELQTEYSQILHTLAVKSLTKKQRHAHAQNWLATDKGSKHADKYNAQTAEFSDSLSKTSFNMIYLREVLPAKTFSEKEFADWLKETKGLTPEMITKS